MFIFRSKPALFLIKDLEYTDNFLLWIAKRNTQYIARVIARDGIDRWIEQRGFICVLDDHRLGRYQDGSGNPQTRIKPDRVRYA